MTPSEELRAAVAADPAWSAMLRKMIDPRRLLAGCTTPRRTPTASGILVDQAGRKYRVTIERIDPPTENPTDGNC